MSRPSVGLATLLLVGGGGVGPVALVGGPKSPTGQRASVLVRRHSIRGANGLRALRTPIRHLGGPGGANHLSHLWNHIISSYSTFTRPISTPPIFTRSIFTLPIFTVPSFNLHFFTEPIYTLLIFTFLIFKQPISKPSISTPNFLQFLLRLFSHSLF